MSDWGKVVNNIVISIYLGNMYTKTLTDWGKVVNDISLSIYLGNVYTKTLTYGSDQTNM